MSSSQDTNKLDEKCLSDGSKVVQWLRANCPNEGALVDAVKYAMVHYIQAEPGSGQLGRILAAMLRNPRQIPSIMGEYTEVFPTVTVNPANGSVTHIRRNRTRRLGEGGKDEDHYGAVVTVPNGEPPAIPQGEHGVILEEIGGEDVINNVSARRFGATFTLLGQ